MKLRIVTPSKAVIDDIGIVAIRVAHADGGFDILPGQELFVTCIAACTVSWSLTDQSRKHCALLSSIVSVTEGRDVAIFAREAVPGEDLETLTETVVSYFNDVIELEQIETDKRRDHAEQRHADG